MNKKISKLNFEHIYNDVFAKKQLKTNSEKGIVSITVLYEYVLYRTVDSINLFLQSGEALCK